jgi:hypothetical protein
MSKKEKNASIVKQVRDVIVQKGLAGKLDIFPVENTFTRRPRYWNDGNVNLFKVHMWDLNKLDGEQLSNEILERVNQAVKYFSL